MCNMQRIFCAVAVVAMVSSSPLETNQEKTFSIPETTETIFSGPETHLVSLKTTFSSSEDHLSDVETTFSGPQIHLSDLETTSVTPGLPADAPAAHIAAHDAARTHTSGEAHTPHDLPSARGRQPSVSQTGARVSERVARTKRGSGVVIRGPFYPYPQGRGYLRYTSGAGHSQGRAPYLLLLAGITFVYSSWRRWA